MQRSWRPHSSAISFSFSSSPFRFSVSMSSLSHSLPFILLLPFRSCYLPLPTPPATHSPKKISRTRSRVTSVEREREQVGLDPKLPARDYKPIISSQILRRASRGPKSAWLRESRQPAITVTEGELGEASGTASNCYEKVARSEKGKFLCIRRDKIYIIFLRQDTVSYALRLRIYRNNPLRRDKSLQIHAFIYCLRVVSP